MSLERVERKSTGSVGAALDAAVSRFSQSDEDRYEKVVSIIRDRYSRFDYLKYAEARIEAYWLQVKLGKRPFRNAAGKIDIFLNRVEKTHPDVYESLIEKDEKTNLTKLISIRDSVIQRDKLSIYQAR